ncbi:hypothetical protein FA95DRAFT_1501730 [Auriscalpium vulgare]|uniref:Uncharacterized protein n=1 Tax=Auriscalpium vulgare TaxID=40419 RepID=A0ACB8RB58_9AGAM|nr:hypothetical protein FA95DRAFT_1501730 [Auriscalpium vulgare]
MTLLTPCSDTYTVLDCEDRVIAVLLAPPKDGEDRQPNERWNAVTGRAGTLFENVRLSGEKRHAFPDKLTHHRRGDFTALSFGISYGGGQTKPGELRHSKTRMKLIDRIERSPDVQQIAGHGNEGLASFFPKPAVHMREALLDLLDSDPTLEMPFKNSAYPTATANLGPETACLLHNDCTNFPGLACAITALGPFNADTGGQMLLIDLRLRIRFPAGCTILLSSAGLRHGNLPVADGERRYSFTQYCTGGIMRWVRHGMRPAGDLTEEERVELDGPKGEGWARQLGRLSKYNELQKDRAFMIEKEKELSARKRRP